MQKINLEFYNKRTKKRVQMDISKIQKKRYGTDQNPRYGLITTDEDGTPMMRFCSKRIWDNIDTSIKKETLR